MTVRVMIAYTVTWFALEEGQCPVQANNVRVWDVYTLLEYSFPRIIFNCESGLHNILVVFEAAVNWTCLRCWICLFTENKLMLCVAV